MCNSVAAMEKIRTANFIQKRTLNGLIKFPGSVPVIFVIFSARTRARDLKWEQTG